MFSKVSNPIRFAKVGEKVDINPHLAMTPSAMADMVQRGLPVNTQNLSFQYFDGVPADKLSFDLPIGDVRGVDTSDVYMAQCEARNHVRKLHRKKLDLTRAQTRPSNLSSIVN